MSIYDAVIIGSGPNGLSAAIVLARAGHKVLVVEGQPTAGGGTRTMELTLPGFHHDICSAIHPMAAASPFFRELKLEQHGVEFIHPPFPLVHPLDNGQAAVLERSVDATAARLGPDEAAYRRLMTPLVRDFDEVLLPLMQNPLTKPPLGKPFATAAFGLKALRSAEGFANAHFKSPLTKALLAGSAAHSFAPLTSAMTNAFAILLTVAGHAVGWPLVKGGSGVLADALVKVLRSHGGEVEVGRPVTSLADVPESRLVLFATHAEVMARVVGDGFPQSYRQALTRFVRGPGTFKVDYALDGPMPWTNPDCLQAATLHVAGTLEDVVASEAAPAAGRLAERPLVLVAQQSLFDDTRAPKGKHTLWTYCHVPNGSRDDATRALEAQLERFAPGFSSRVLAKSVKDSTALEASNSSYVGGDISGGAVEGTQLFFRPTVGLPYRTPNPKVLICSSSAPPGPAVHGMCGYHAAQVALRRLRKA